MTNDLTRVGAGFTVSGSAHAEAVLDLAREMTPDEIAELVWDEAAVEADVSLCHECARKISDPEVTELTGLTIDGVDYEKVGDRWVAQS